MLHSTPDIDQPPDPNGVPWGASLVKEYVLILDQWRDLDLLDRPGIPAPDRDRLATDKLDTFGRAAIVRARAVNELLTIMRWSAEDAPGPLTELLREIVTEIVRPELVDLAAAVVRLEERLHRRGVAA